MSLNRSSSCCIVRCATRFWRTLDCYNNLARSWDGLGADTLDNSRHTNMKEPRFDAADGVWRVAFAFDPRRRAILLLAGGKSGGSEKRFYKQFIAKADKRLDFHLARLKKERKWYAEER